MSLLALRAVSVGLGGRTVLDGLSFAVAAGEVVGLIGPNGAGKSTALRAALGLARAEGEILLGSAPLAALSAVERARRAAYLPQEREIAWALTVEALVGLGRAPWRNAGRGAAADRAAVEAALARMELEALRDRPATRLSGGERARALIARALAQEAPLLLADEPTAGLDPAHALSLMETFRALAAEGRGVLATLHDLTLAARWCDRLILLDRGRVAAEGAAAEALTPERLASVYGVEARVARMEDGPVVVPLRRLR